jgi:hypothetical protein
MLATAPAFVVGTAAAIAFGLDILHAVRTWRQAEERRHALARARWVDPIGYAPT